MLIRRLTHLPLVAAVLAALPAQAADYTDTARVVSATPIVERVREPRQECTAEAPPQIPQAERSVIAPIIGGVAGALLGSTVGRGSGRDAATAAGKTDFIVSVWDWFDEALLDPTSAVCKELASEGVNKIILLMRGVPDAKRLAIKR